MKPVLRLSLCFVLVLGLNAHAQTDYVLAIVNHLRTPGGACAANASPLISSSALDLAASRAAHGSELEAALKASAYRATAAQLISISGEAVRARLQALLAGKFCAQVGDAKLAELGVHETRNQLWMVLAAPFAPRLDLTRQQLADRMLALVNTARGQARRCGDKAFAAAPAVAWNAVLETAAAQHARDMAVNDYFSHDGHDGSTPAQRVTGAGYRWRATGENIAAGQLSPEAAVAGWIASPGHCANLMNAAYTEMGVAAAVSTRSQMGLYWAQEFGAPR